MSTESKITAEEYFGDIHYNDYAFDADLDSTQYPENTGWTDNFNEWRQRAHSQDISEEFCKNYFVGYAVSPVIIYSSKVYIATYIPINSSLEQALEEHKDKKLLLNQIDSKYIRAVIIKHD